MTAQRRYTAEEAEAMTSAERAAIARAGLVTDLDDADDRAVAMMERARPRLKERLDHIVATS